MSPKKPRPNDTSNNHEDALPAEEGSLPLEATPSDDFEEVRPITLEEILNEEEFEPGRIIDVKIDPGDNPIGG